MRRANRESAMNTHDSGAQIEDPGCKSRMRRANRKSPLYTHYIFEKVTDPDTPKRFKPKTEEFCPTTMSSDFCVIAAPPNRSNLHHFAKRFEALYILSSGAANSEKSHEFETNSAPYR
jgi:hypothetical protein